MRTRFCFFWGFLLLSVNIKASSTPPPLWSVTATFLSHTIILPSNLSSDIAGEALQAGDYIGFFYEDDGQKICAGYGIWTNTGDITVTVYGNTATAPEKNGFDIEELFQVKVWQVTNQTETNVEVSYFPVGSLGGLINATNLFGVDDFSAVNNIEYNNTPPWDVEACNSLNNQNIILDRTNDRFDANINGIELSTDDWIGVFYTDGQGGEHCQYAIQYPSQNESIAMLTCIDDPLTNFKDGFATDEPYKFRIWKTDVGGEYLSLDAEFWPLGEFGFVPTAEENFVGLVKTSYLKNLNEHIDIGDTDCSNPIDITCGTHLFNLSNDTGAESGIDVFCNSDNYVNGPEVYFKLTQTTLSDVKIAITNLQQDLELYILDANCNAANCIAISENQETEAEILLLNDVAPGEYFIVLDGYINATGAFDLEVICGDFGGTGGGGGGGEIDPEDPNDPPTPECPKILGCNTTVNCSTTGLENNVYSYGCTPTRFNGGGEKIFTFSSPETKWIYISMIPAVGVNLDLFALSNLNPETDCLKSSTEFGDAAEGFFLYAVANKEYFIIVDGYDEAAGGFSLTAGTCIEPGGGGGGGGGGSPPIAIDCDNLDEVFCGISYYGTNATGVANYAGWGDCSGRSNTGKEILLEFNNPAPQQILFLLRNMDENLNLYILDACNPDGCLGQGGTKGRDRYDNEDEAVIMPFLAAGTYYIVIDGVENASSDFELYIECDQTSYQCLDIPLEQGGTNYISSNLLPPDRTLKTIIDHYEGIILSISDDKGNAYFLGDPCNQNCPQIWEDLDAFAILLNPAIQIDTLVSICGVPVDTLTVKNLIGYNPLNNEPVRSNYLGYPFEEEQTVSETFSSVENLDELNQLVYKTPSALQVFAFAAPNSNNYVMKPGQGYILYSYTDRDFSYRTNEVPYKENGCQVLKMPWYGTFNIGHAHFKTSILQDFLNDGDEFAITNKNGDVVSSFLYRNENSTLVLQGDMAQTSLIEGLRPDEHFLVKIFSAKENRFFDYIPVFETKENKFQAGTSYELKALKPMESVALNTDKLSFYPNPASDILFISGAIQEGNTISIQSLDGKTIHKSKVLTASNTSLNIHDLPTGLYIITVQTDVKLFSHKLIKF